MPNSPPQNPQPLPRQSSSQGPKPRAQEIPNEPIFLSQPEQKKSTCTLPARTQSSHTPSNQPSPWVHITRHENSPPNHQSDLFPITYVFPSNPTNPTNPSAPEAAPRSEEHTSELQSLR